jgi:hypothetical protein
MRAFHPSTADDVARYEQQGLAPIPGQVYSKQLTELHQQITCVDGPACLLPAMHPRAHSFPNTETAFRLHLAGSNVCMDLSRVSRVVLKVITDDALVHFRPAVDRLEFQTPAFEIPIGPFAGRYFLFNGTTPEKTSEVLPGVVALGRDHRPIPMPNSYLGQEPSRVVRERSGNGVYARVIEGAEHTVTWSRSPLAGVKFQDLPSAISEALANAVREPDATQPKARTRRAS